LRGFAWTLAALLLLLACGAAPAAAARGPGWDYEVRFDEGLKRAHVRLCFRRFLPKRLVLGHADAHGAIDLTPVAGSAALTRRPDGTSYVPVGLRAGGCLAWSVDLDALVRAGAWRKPASRVGRDLVVAPGALLLRPALWSARMDVTVRIVLPEGFRPAVPWTPMREAGRYRLDAYALRLESTVAFGRFAVELLDVGGATLDVAVLDAPHRATRAGIRTWLTKAAGAVAHMSGRFPVRRALVLVHPVPARHPPVIFGMAMRGGGPHVRLLLSSAAEDAELVGEWVGVHELTHLGMPWNYDTDAWFQEGFATYYQEIRRGRAGLLSEQEVWQNLHDGFGRGRRSGGERTLSAESRAMHEHHTYHRVYWAGAATALLLDVELRRRFPQRWCLDDLMQFWDQLHGGTRGGPATGVQLMHAADRRIGQPLCVPLARAQLERTDFPELARLYGELGVRVASGRVVLNEEAPLAALRQALTAPKAALRRSLQSPRTR
jgi:hypothetical protein